MNQSKWAQPEQPVQQADDQSTSAPPASSTLSATTPNFTPLSSAQPAECASNIDDSFAQTGAAQDDLFDDIVPVDASMRIRSEDDLFSDDFTPVAQPIVEQIPPAVATSARGGAGRGLRGRGRGGQGGAGRNTGPAAAKRDSAPQTSQAHRPSNPSNGETQREITKTAAAAAPEGAPAGPRTATVASVRGDRHATGGIRKPKMTEEELAEKMAQIQVKNASLTASHARAEADAASFAEREEQAKLLSAQRQKEERRDRRQMMGERERNRMRKLKAMEGREWDAEKNEDDFQRGGRFDKKGKFAGDSQDYSDGREYLYKEPRESKGGSRGRGGGVASGRSNNDRPQQAPTTADFPALSTTKEGSEAGKKDLLAAAPAASGKSWADQVETSNAVATEQ